MNILVYTIAEKFGKELMKTAALVAVSVAAQEIVGRVIDAVHNAGQREEAVAQEVQELDLADLFQDGTPAQTQPPIHVNVVVNSYNEKNDNSKKNELVEPASEDLYEVSENCPGCGEAECDGCNGYERAED